MDLVVGTRRSTTRTPEDRKQRPSTTQDVRRQEKGHVHLVSFATKIATI